MVCRREELQQFAAQQLRSSDHVTLEATTNTWPVVDILRPCVARVVESNPLKTKAITEAKVVWQPDQATQVRRSLLTHRTGLMAQRARHKNPTQCLLGRLLLTPPCKHLWSKAGMAWLRSLELTPADRLLLESELRQLEHVDEELLVIDRQLVELARGEPRVQLMMTLPGVNYVVALGLLSTLGDITRFRDGAHVASYLGLVPTTRQSGQKCYHGRITKAGNPPVRWLLTQACQHVARHPGPLGAFYRRLVKRKNRQVAIMALARKLVTVAYLMFKNNEPYRYARPERMAKTFTQLRRKHRAPEAVSQEPNLHRSARSGLAAVYETIGLPEAAPP